MHLKQWLWPEPRRQEITDWVIRLGAALFFVAVGLDKFASRSEWPKIFAQLGGQWFRYTTGIVETLGAALMLIPRTTAMGVGLLGCAMLGAILAHLFVLGDPFSSVIPAALLVILLAVGRKLCAPPDEYTGLRL